MDMIYLPGLLITRIILEFWCYLKPETSVCFIPQGSDIRAGEQPVLIIFSAIFFYAILAVFLLPMLLEQFRAKRTVKAGVTTIVTRDEFNFKVFKRFFIVISLVITLGCAYYVYQVIQDLNYSPSLWRINAIALVIIIYLIYTTIRGLGKTIKLEFTTDGIIISRYSNGLWEKINFIPAKEISSIEITASNLGPKVGYRNIGRIWIKIANGELRIYPVPVAQIAMYKDAIGRLRYPYQKAIGKNE